MKRQIGNLPHALGEGEVLARRFVGKQPAVFLDYDGTLTPIRDRPEDAVISDSMREAVRRLAERVPVVVVSGRDRDGRAEAHGTRQPDRGWRPRFRYLEPGRRVHTA